MRILFKDQAQGFSHEADAKGRCAICGRLSNPDMCRKVRNGWFCWAQGLLMDPALWLHPTKDPLTPAEQAVVDHFTPLIAAAGEKADRALEEYTAAQAEYHHALTALDEPAGMSWGNIFGLSGKSSAAKKTAAAAAQQRFERAGSRLRRARARLTDLKVRMGQAKAAAGAPQRPADPDEDDDY